MHIVALGPMTLKYLKLDPYSLRQKCRIYLLGKKIMVISSEITEKQCVKENDPAIRKRKYGENWTCATLRSHLSNSWALALFLSWKVAFQDCIMAATSAKLNCTCSVTYIDVVKLFLFIASFIILPSVLFGINYAFTLFTALHGMQTRSSDENSVCPSVCLSVKRVHCDKTEERTVQTFIPYEILFSLFLRRRLVGGGWPLLPEILGQPAPVAAKSPIFN